jgi:hypothetical protein
VVRQATPARTVAIQSLDCGTQSGHQPFREAPAATMVTAVSQVMHKALTLSLFALLPARTPTQHAASACCPRRSTAYKAGATP